MRPPRSTVRVLPALLVVAACLLAARDAHASDETIHPDSWVYHALRIFELRGLVRVEDAGPLSRREVERSVREIASSSSAVSLTPHEEHLLKRLSAEFIGTAGEPQRREDPPLAVIRDGERFFAVDVAAGGTIRKVIQRKKGEAVGLLRPSMLLVPGERFTVEAAYRFAMSPERDLDRRTGRPSPRERNWRGLTSDYERAYIAAAGRGWRVQAGRDYLWWGPARPGGLILSSGAGSIDHLAADISLGAFTLRTLHAVLDPRFPRRLAGHRLEIRLPGGIRAGIAETVLYTRRGLDGAYLLPLGSFYANQYNECEDDNILWSIDASVPAARGLILSGELLIDDYQYENDPPAPDKVGFSLAADLLLRPRGHDLLLQAAYTRLGIYTYSHKDSLRTVYLTGTGDEGIDRILGDQLGPDADRWIASARAALHPRAVFSLSWTRVRRGEGNDLREWDWIADPSPVFPSGAVTRETVLFASLDVDLGGGSVAEAGGGWRFLSGRDPDRRDAFAMLSLLWDF